MRIDRGEEDRTDERRIRRRTVPRRRLGERLIIARPADGAPVVLDGMAHLIWDLMDEWTTNGRLAAQLADRFPDASAAERADGLRHVIQLLTDDDLLDVD